MNPSPLPLLVNIWLKPHSDIIKYHTHHCIRYIKNHIISYTIISTTCLFCFFNVIKIQYQLVPYSAIINEGPMNPGNARVCLVPANRGTPLPVSPPALLSPVQNQRTREAKQVKVHRELPGLGPLQKCSVNFSHFLSRSCSFSAGPTGWREPTTHPCSRPGLCASHLWPAEVLLALDGPHFQLLLRWRRYVRTPEAPGSDPLVCRVSPAGQCTSPAQASPESSHRLSGRQTDPNPGH